MRFVVSFLHEKSDLLTNTTTLMYIKLLTNPCIPIRIMGFDWCHQHFYTDRCFLTKGSLFKSCTKTYIFCNKKKLNFLITISLNQERKFLEVETFNRNPGRY